MTPNFKYFNIAVAALLVIFFVMYATGCTSATITTSEGTEIRYTDFHPTGNAVEIDAEWLGVGNLKTRRSSDGVESIIDAVPIL